MNELKELCWIALFLIILAPTVLWEVGYVFAKATYKIHTTRANAKKYEILQKNFNLKNGGKLYV